nr:TIR domain-containing protein [Salmonella enterica]
MLHHEANEGQTIIEKLEKHIDTVSYAVVLYTACDEGKAKNETELKKSPAECCFRTRLAHVQAIA